jgi:hypothetical protein
MTILPPSGPSLPPTLPPVLPPTNTTPTLPPTTTTPTTPPTTTVTPPLPSDPTPGTGLPPTPPGSALQNADSFTAISSLVGSGLAGGVATMNSIGNLKLIGQGMKGVEVPTGAEESTRIGGGIGDKAKGMMMGAKGLGSSTIQGAKYGAIIGGSISALTNGYMVLSGKTTAPEAVSNLVADTATVTLSGAGGALAGSATALGLSALGMGGLPLTILAAGIGLTGAVGVQLLTQKTGIYDSIKNAVKGMLGGS